MKIKKVIGLGAIGIAVAFVVFVVGTDLITCLLRDKFYELYTGRLNAWVAEGGPMEKVQKQVADTCGMLVMTEAGFYEKLQLATFYRDELDFRGDVCLQMTVNRVYKQPSLEKVETINMICDDTREFHAIFPKLCRLSGLR